MGEVHLTNNFTKEVMQILRRTAISATSTMRSGGERRDVLGQDVWNFGFGINDLSLASTKSSRNTKIVVDNTC